MATANIQIKGLDQVLKKVNNLQQMTAVKHALKAGALHIKGKIDRYPPASDANRPNQPRWYERGYGSKWMRKDGTIGGRKTSETLGRKWTIQARNRGLTQVVGNNVSYGPFVQDADKQAVFHKQRGWPTAQQVAKDEADVVVKFIADEIDRAMKA